MFEGSLCQYNYLLLMDQIKSVLRCFSCSLKISLLSSIRLSKSFVGITCSILAISASMLTLKGVLLVKICNIFSSSWVSLLVSLSLTTLPSKMSFNI